jgi:peptidoglycan-N-acetylglucosamine deacetylase
MRPLYPGQWGRGDGGEGVVSGDGWEPGPNPVARIITVRTAQVGGAAALTGLGLCLPPERFWLLVPWGGAAVAVGLAAYFIATFYARTSFGVPLLVRLPPSAENAVALTFDDGPHPKTTPILLDALAAAGAKATFFLVGERARAYPDLARRITAEGHGIGVHGLRHRTMVLQSAREIERDIAEAARILEDVTGQPLPVRLLRPPYGFKTWTLCWTARRLGWTLVSWSNDPRDYDPVSADELAGRAAARLTPGDIVLLHERPETDRTNDALPLLLRTCREQGLSCVSLTNVEIDPLTPE